MDANATKKFQGENPQDLSEVSGPQSPEKLDNQADAGDNVTSEAMTVETVSEEIKSQLPPEALPLFVTAFNSIYDQNGDRNAAMAVAWQTIEHNEQFEKGADGKWQFRPIEQGMHSPQPTSAA